MSATTTPLFEVEDLRIEFGSRADALGIVNGISLSLEAGSTLGIVGESGCGKSILSLAALRLLPAGARIAGGDIRLDGRSLPALDDRAIRRLRGNDVSMIFQEPMAALNPVFTVGQQLAEVFQVHEGADRATARRRAIEALASVGVPSPEIRVDSYPRQLSGGMRQRVMIAMALACRPRLLIADEPTTALDVTIQAQILELIRNLQEETGTAVLFISHDFGVVAEVCDRVAVLYCGQVVEEAPVEVLFDTPCHPYTRGLIRATPQLDGGDMPSELFEIRGTVPSPGAMPSGCPFHPRCDVARAICGEQPPHPVTVGPGHRVSCWEHIDG